MSDGFYEEKMEGNLHGEKGEIFIEYLFIRLDEDDSLSGSQKCLIDIIYFWALKEKEKKQNKILELESEIRSLKKQLNLEETFKDITK